MRVYLAGPITGLSYGATTDWRELAAKTLWDHGHLGVSPMRGKDYLAREVEIADAYPSSALSCAKGITTRDRWDCFRADIVLVNVLGAGKVSIGTVMEIAWADAYRKPVVLAMEAEGNPHEHAMIRESAGFILPTLAEALHVIVAIVSERSGHIPDGVKSS